MNAFEALANVNTALRTVKNNPALTVDEETDMLQQKILDSLDCLLLVMELDELCGFSVPDDVDLVSGGYFKVGRLVTLLTEQHSS